MDLQDVVVGIHDAGESILTVIEKMLEAVLHQTRIFSTYPGRLALLQTGR